MREHDNRQAPSPSLKPLFWIPRAIPKRYHTHCVFENPWADVRHSPGNHHNLAKAQVLAPGALGFIPTTRRTATTIRANL